MLTLDFISRGGHTMYYLTSSDGLYYNKDTGGLSIACEQTYHHSAEGLTYLAKLAGFKIN